MEVLLLAFSFAAILVIGYRVQKTATAGTPLRWLALAIAAACVLFVLWNAGRRMAAGRNDAAPNLAGSRYGWSAGSHQQRR